MSSQRKGETPTVKVNLVRRRLLLGGTVVGIGGVATAGIHDRGLGGPQQTFRGAVPWQEGAEDVPPGGSAPSRRTCLFSWTDDSPGSSGAAITIIWAARGPRARRNRATKPASAPQNSIELLWRRSTGTSSRISMALHSAN